MSRALIINADDFGWDFETANETVALLEAGRITSATILLGRPATKFAANFARENSKRFSFGLHFNIVDGATPFDSNRGIMALAPRNVFPSSGIQRLRALLRLLEPEQIRREFRAQLNELRGAGVHVSHVDSHGHLHKFPNVISALSGMLREEGLRVRRPQSIFFSRSWRKVLQNSYFNKRFVGLDTTDAFFMLEKHNDHLWFEKLMRCIPCGVTELGVHPGAAAAWRRMESAPLRRDDFFRTVEDHEVELTNFRDARISGGRT